MRYAVRHLPRGASAVTEEEVEADSEMDVRSRVEAAGSVVLTLRRASPAIGRATHRLDVALWCREMQSLLKAGMTAVEAIETLASSQTNEAVRSSNARLLRSLRSGAALSRAMREAQVYPEVLVAGVTASERTSTLAEALHDFVRYDDMLGRLKRQAISAALYPAVVVALGAVIALFLLLYVIPRFTMMYGTQHRELSTATALVLWLSRSMRDFGWVVPVAIAALAAGFAWRPVRSFLTQLLGRALDRAPILSDQWRHFRLAKLYHAMTLLFRGGYTVSEALQVCTSLDLGARTSDQVQEARSMIAAGKSASAALAHCGLADATASRLLAVGERTGDFAHVLEAIGERHAQAFTVFIERATRLVEPLLLLAVALVIGSLVVMMYMPIFDVAGGLGVAR